MTVVDYQNYKEFLNDKLDELDHGGRGSRARLSRAITCQTAYTAQVLRGSAHFSLEHGEAINDFLGHTEEEGHFFLLLIQFAKAGTPKLKARFKKLIENLRKDHSILKNRLEVDEALPLQDQSLYYSSWIYGAVHALTSVPGFQNTERISQRLGVGIRTAGEAMEFLLRSGLLNRDKNGNIKIGKRQIHLGVESPLVSKHHINWRLQAIRAVEKDPAAGLHYSSVISISKKDEAIIREKLIGLLKEVKPIIRASEEEEVYSLSIDFFSL